MSEDIARYCGPVRNAYPDAQISLDPKCAALSRRFGLNDRAAQLRDLLARVPPDHYPLSDLGPEIPDHVRRIWDDEMSWFLASAENPAMEWMLYCINRDAKAGQYEVLFLAECRGIPSPELSAAAMLDEVFRSWNFHRYSDYPGWSLVDQLRQLAWQLDERRGRLH